MKSKTDAPEVAERRSPPSDRRAAIPDPRSAPAIDDPRSTPGANGAGRNWSIDDAKELYNIEGWGIGYFDVNERGHVTVHPTRDPNRGLDLFEIAMDLQAQGVGLPLLLRFSDILRTRVHMLT